MNPFGLGDVVLRWIEAYLTGCVSRIHVGPFSGPFQCAGLLDNRFFLFVNDLPDAIELLTLLFAIDVKMVTRRAQNIHLHSPDSLHPKGRMRPS